jgi:rRNA maturation endonuclease Nob1
MKHVSLTYLIFIYLFIYLNSIFGIWLWNVWRLSRREKQALRHRLRCTICAFEFEDKSDTVLPRCPRCGSLNERLKYQAL